jgi:hypothetical protein
VRPGPLSAKVLTEFKRTLDGTPERIALRRSLSYPRIAPPNDASPPLPAHGAGRKSPGRPPAAKAHAAVGALGGSARTVERASAGEPGLELGTGRLRDGF